LSTKQNHRKGASEARKEREVVLAEVVLAEVVLAAEGKENRLTFLILPASQIRIS
jgi:hypothetical protein